MSNISIKAHPTKHKHPLVFVIAAFQGRRKGLRSVVISQASLAGSARSQMSTHRDRALPGFWACFQGLTLGLSGSSRMHVTLKCPHTPQKIRHLPWHPPSFPKLPHWHLPEKRGPQKLVKVIIRQPSTPAWNKLKSWANASVWGQSCGPVTWMKSG